MSITLHPDFLSEPKDTRYLLALSGGRDSVALLHVLLELGIKGIVLCHTNHKLRGKESDQDAAFVQELASLYKLPCEIQTTDVAQRMHETGESLELAARNTRRENFAQCAQKHNCYKVIFAHHADDQAETVLFNLLRGSGGLRGMNYSRNHSISGKELEFLRPLLLTPRAEIDRYLRSNQLDYREDSSNAEPIAARNRLRNEALPLLKDIIGHDIHTAINRAATISETQEQALRETLSIQQIEDPQGRLYLPTLKSLPKALQQIAIHDYLKKHSIPNISNSLLAECFAIIHEENASKINLPGNQFFRRKEQRAFIQ